MRKFILVLVLVMMYSLEVEAVSEERGYIYIGDSRFVGLNQDVGLEDENVYVVANKKIYNFSGKTSKLKLRGCNAYQPDLSRALFCEICSVKDNIELLFLKITLKGVSHYGKYI